MAGDNVNRSVGNRFASVTYDESLEMNQINGWYKNQYNSCKICISKIVLTKTKNPQNHQKKPHTERVKNYRKENNIALEMGSQIWYDSYMYTFATELF